MNKLDRLAIYKALLTVLKAVNHRKHWKYGTDFSMCESVNEIIKNGTCCDILDSLPELLAFKPKSCWADNTEYWFTPYDAESRIAVVTKAIRLTLYDMLIEDLINHNRERFFNDSYNPSNLSWGLCNWFDQATDYDFPLLKELFPELAKQRTTFDAWWFGDKSDWQTRLVAVVEARKELLNLLITHTSS